MPLMLGFGLSLITVNETPKDDRSPTLTITSPVTAFGGTVVVREVLDAAVTVARIEVLPFPANVTTSSDAMGLKPVPPRVTMAPGTPLEGPALETLISRSEGVPTAYVEKCVMSAEAMRPDSSTMAVPEAEN